LVNTTHWLFTYITEIKINLSQEDAYKNKA
jgi:hypothetical protein